MPFLSSASFEARRSFRLWPLAVLPLVWVALAPARPHAAVPVREPISAVCTLMAGPGNAFTYVPAPAQPMLRSQGLAAGSGAATINVTYVGFAAFPAAQAAFQSAVDIWSGLVSSPVPINVQATFGPLGTNVLGSAGPLHLFQGFAGATMPSTWYPDALADQLSGSDNAPGQFDIQATFNSNFSAWYFGTDGAPPAGKYDFVSVVLHELGHGLGFIGSAGWSSGTGSLGFSGVPIIYDRFTVTETGAALLGLTNPSLTLGTQLTQGFNSGNPHGPGVYWGGANGVSGNGGLTARLYTPATWTPGSSYSHLDENAFPAGNVNSLMTPVLSGAEAIHNPGPITLGTFADMGWGAVVVLPPPPVISMQPQGQTIVIGHSATLSVAATGASLSYQWYQGASPSTASPIIGANLPNFTTPVLNATTSYWVQVGNAGGLTNSNTAIVTAVSLANVGRDFSADGRPDLLFQNNAGQLFAWFMSGTLFSGGSFITPNPIGANLLVATVNDFTGEGKPDLVLQNQLDNSVTIYKMDGVTRVSEQTIPFSSTQWKIVGSGDLNGDGNADIIWENFALGQFYVWFMAPMNGNAGYGGPNGAFSGAFIVQSNQSLVALGLTTLRVVGVADLDLDGKADLVLEDDTTGDLRVWYLNGVTRTLDAPIASGHVSPLWKVRAVGDYDGDQRPDLIFQHQTTGDLYAWFLTGAALTNSGYLSPANVNPVWKVVGPK